METHSSILAWEIPDRQAWWATIHRVTKSWTRLSAHELKVMGQAEVVGQPFLLTSALDPSNYSLLS